MSQSGARPANERRAFREHDVMQRADLPNAGDCSSTPPTLDYGVVRQAGCASIEPYPDGVVIRATVPRMGHWVHVVGYGAIALFLIAIALPSGDDWQWRGIDFHREGMIARIMAGLVGTGVAIGIGIRLLRPRGPVTLTLRDGLFSYSEPRVRGQAHFECPLCEVEAIDHEPESHGDGGTLRIKTSRWGRRILFGDLNPKEIDAIAGAIIPVWRAAIADRAR